MSKKKQASRRKADKPISLAPLSFENAVKAALSTGRMTAAKRKKPRIPYIGKKPMIRGELLKCAIASPMETPTYGEFGPRVGIPARGPWKAVLDFIAKEETDQGLPDITFLLINKNTGYPSQIGFVAAKPPSLAQRQRAKVEVQKIIDRYNPSAQNPF